MCKVNLLSKGLCKKHNKENHLKYLACEHCGEKFKEVWMLEVHLKLHKHVKTIEIFVVNFSLRVEAVKA